MYIFHRGWHDNLVTMETRLKWNTKIVSVSLMYGGKINLVNLRGIQQTRKTYKLKCTRGQNPPPGQIGLMELPYQM